MQTQKRIRMGMVGGGAGAFIGKVHRHAAALDGNIELVCGAFSSDASVSLATGLSLHLTKERCYPDFLTMFDQEAKLPEDQRMQFVSIVTPNHLHFPVAVAALNAGFHVMSDKPATYNLEEAMVLKDIVEKSGLLYGLTHTYLGYPLVQHAKALVSQGALGKVKKVIAEYQQGWLASKEDENNKQASWRVDPKQAGISCCMGDIGIHAANLLEYVTSETCVEICADLDAVVEGRLLDDDASLLMRLSNGARGVLLASQIAVGEENNLTLRVYGEKASLVWHQQEPNSLWLKYQNAPDQLIRTGVGEFPKHVSAFTRTPSGHPEGYLEAFANLYSAFALQVEAFPEKQTADTNYVPGIEAAIRGMAFIENAVAASDSEKKWHAFVTDKSPLQSK